MFTLIKTIVAFLTNIGKNANTYINKYSKYGVIVLAVLLYFSFKSCNSHRDDANNWKAKYTYEHNTVDSFKNKKGQTVVEQVVPQTTNKQDIKQLSAQVFDLKKKYERKVKEVDALVRIGQEAKRDTVFVPYDSSKPIKSDSFYTQVDGKTLVNKDSVIIPPRHFRDTTAYSDIDGTIELKGVKINNISLKDTLSFRIAEIKPSLFKAKELKIQAIHTSPFYDTKNIQSIVLKQKTNNWNKFIKPAIVILSTLVIKNQIK